MKAAAPQALLLTSVQKNGTAAKTAGQRLPSGVKGPGVPGTRPAEDAFSRIVRAKLDAKTARAARAQGSALAEALEAAAGGFPGEQNVAQAPGAAAKGAALTARKKASRSNGPASRADGESPAAGDPREAIRLSPRQGESRRDSPDTSTTSASISGRRGSEPKVYVLDLRKAAERGLEESRASGRVLPSQVSEKDSGGLQAGGRAAAPRDAAASAAKGKAGRAGGAPTAFESALERLRGMAGSELVKTTGIILRDGGGEIRMVLKPESLGSVRIRMNIVDNGIEGRIIVDTPAVKQVLDGSIDALARALTAQGFQTASLEVSVGGQNADGGRAAEQAPSGLRRESADGFERNVPGIESLSLGDLLVNLFA